MKHYVRLLRVKHYIKNLLILFPAFFSGEILNLNQLRLVVVGAVAFCFISSAVYIINDLCDAEYDRRHPVKKSRPIASGTVSVRDACVMLLMLFALDCFLLYLIKAEMLACTCCFVYVLVNLAYSMGCKNLPVWDIVLLGAGYPLRVLFGGFLVGGGKMAVSSWLLLTVLSISFYLAFGKRKGEMEKMLPEGKTIEEDCLKILTRPVLLRYTPQYLEAHMYLCLGLGLVFYSLWCIEKSMAMVCTVPFVLVICMKYNLMANGNAGGDPVEVVFASKGLMLLVVLYAVAVTLILYLT